MDLTEDGAEDEEPVEEVRGDKRVSADVDGQGAIFDFIEAVALIAVRREDGDSVPELLQPDGSVNNKPLCTTDAQVRVDEPDVEVPLLSGCHCVRVVRVVVMVVVVVVVVAVVMGTDLERGLAGCSRPAQGNSRPATVRLLQSSWP